MISKMSFRFSKTSINAVNCPAGKSKVRVRDTEVPSLALLVTANGSRSFFLYKKIDGRPVEVRIGSAAECTVDQARRRAVELLGEYIAGRNPAAEKVARRDGATLGDLWDSYLEHHAKPHKRPASIAGDNQIYNQHLAAWKARRLTEITPEAVDLLKTRIGQTSHVSANRMLALLSCMFRKCGYRFGLARNWTPTAGLERFREKVRSRVLSPDELMKVLDTLKTWPNETYRDYFLLTLYTGARRGNVAAMQWEHLDLDRRTWKIPGEVTKNGSPLTVTLIPEAVEVLKKRPDHSPYVFPSKLVTVEQVEEARKLKSAGQSTRQIARAVGVSQTAMIRILKPEFVGGTHRPLNGISKAWANIIKAAGIKERVTVHDLRRTFATAMVEAGAELSHVAAALGHKTLVTTQKHYAIAREGKTREAVETGMVAMLAAAEKAREAPVQGTKGAAPTPAAGAA